MSDQKKTTAQAHPGPEHVPCWPRGACPQGDQASHRVPEDQAKKCQVGDPQPQGACGGKQRGDQIDQQQQQPKHDVWQSGALGGRDRIGRQQDLGDQQGGQRGQQPRFPISLHRLVESLPATADVRRLRAVNSTVAMANSTAATSNRISTAPRVLVLWRKKAPMPQTAVAA